MNKSQLVEQIAKNAELSKSDAERALRSAINAIVGALSDGGEVSLVGFGTFKVNDRSARIGRNPKTGEELNIPAAKVPAFKAGKALKEACNH
ncbi:MULTISPECIES: HU family DNA-binding protein [Vibrio]|jgi:nucleoid DNA-binding protein|uniref:DNA-binding protein HU n=1 Tax=Vibrio lentus TaxID=136468 RepID=A0A1B9QMV1_9VIBR|nr:MULTISPECIES: HU family DNA-binding protein [Vibrio]OCH66115.1 DNA-binding protein HU [Vibrio lentus]PME55110.1 DNA-binding protein HU [Vibrio lentus]PME55785.1 DNA-binding protein HU [Vibrio lentus]PME91155.1 DNA-binding protein HU [Vibrio lentus]PMG77071.1 DNA-binding protein HU [Vibrio lentus]